MTTWEIVLDRFAARLDEQRCAILAGHPGTVAPFAPPPSIGPIPPELRWRAESLLQEALELQAEMTAALAATTREVQLVRRFVDATAPRLGGAFVDSPL